MVEYKIGLNEFFQWCALNYKGFKFENILEDWLVGIVFLKIKISDVKEFKTSI